MGKCLYSLIVNKILGKRRKIESDPSFAFMRGSCEGKANGNGRTREETVARKRSHARGMHVLLRYRISHEETVPYKGKSLARPGPTGIIEHAWVRRKILIVVLMIGGRSFFSVCGTSQRKMEVVTLLSFLFLIPDRYLGPEKVPIHVCIRIGFGEEREFFCRGEKVWTWKQASKII